jgi:hypothetical protein
VALVLIAEAVRTSMESVEATEKVVDFMGAGEVTGETYYF